MSAPAVLPIKFQEHLQVYIFYVKFLKSKISGIETLHSDISCSFFLLSFSSQMSELMQQMLASIVSRWSRTNIFALEKKWAKQTK